MAGHSKWANIKHRKGAADAKRSKIFTKLIKELTVASRIGGGDINSNPRLRLAVDKAKAVSVPKDNIERAIKRGTGEIEGQAIEEISYEGYGPGGVAIVVECATDNKVRTVAEIRTIFSKKGGAMGEINSVAWMFDRKGLIKIKNAGLNEDTVMEHALTAGAEDLTNEGDFFTVTTAFTDFNAVLTTLTEQGYAIVESNTELVPKNLVPVTDEEKAQGLLNLIDALEDNDDVQHVWANFDISDSLLETLS